MNAKNLATKVVCVASLGAALFGLAACGGGGAVSDDAAAQSVLHKQLDAYRKQDARAFYALTAPSFRDTCSYDSLKDSIQSELESALTDENITDASKLDYTDVKVQIQGDTAKLAFNVRNGDKVVDTVDMFDPLVLTKVDGHWYEDSDPSVCSSTNAGGASHQPTARAATPTARAVQPTRTANPTATGAQPTARAASPTPGAVVAKASATPADAEIDIAIVEQRYLIGATHGVVQKPVETFSFNGSNWGRAVLEVQAGTPLTVKIQSLAVHSLKLYADQAFTNPVDGADTGKTCATDASATCRVGDPNVLRQFTVALKAKTYYFRCEVYPNIMQGTITAK